MRNYGLVSILQSDGLAGRSILIQLKVGGLPVIELRMDRVEFANALFGDTDRPCLYEVKSPSTPKESE